MERYYKIMTTKIPKSPPKPTVCYKCGKIPYSGNWCVDCNGQRPTSPPPPKATKKIEIIIRNE